MYCIITDSITLIRCMKSQDGGKRKICHPASLREHTLVSDKTRTKIRVIIYLCFTESLAQSYIFLM